MRPSAQLQQRFTQAVETRLAALNAPPTPSVAQLRAHGEARFRALELPGRGNEFWKYSPASALMDPDLLVAAGSIGAPVQIPRLPGVTPTRLLIVEGRLVNVENVQPGVTVTPNEGPVEERDGDPRLFVALNAALSEGHVLIHIAAGSRLSAPIELVLAQGESRVARSAMPRVRVVVGAGAEVTLIERQVGTHRVWTNAVLELAIEPEANVAHHRVGLETGQGLWLTALDVDVQELAHYRLLQALAGSALRRNEVDVRLHGSGSDFEMASATFTQGGDHLDNQVAVQHLASDCRSHQTHRSIAANESRTVLNGRIYIARDAQRTDAQLSTKNLLLHKSAEVDAKPELEIYADNVKCAHGATVGSIDPEALFYLRSRGFSMRRARSVLSFAFLAGVVDAFGIQPLGDEVRATLEQAFSHVETDPEPS
ncbi:MAG: Fe-S cluster assembly protein SufD [Pseudomonadota bacterium]|nr:Fe-S cluster assembly protein SufD [Pseudomonadota bacterium]